MVEITLKGTVTRDHKLTADVPTDVPVGEVDLILRVATPIQVDPERNQRLIDYVRKLQRQLGRHSRAPKDTDRQFEDERSSWGAR
jgi:hypothetical protein